MYLGSDGSELDLGAQDYTSSSWADLDGQSTHASNDGSETLSPYDTVTVSGDHTAGGDPGQVYLYTGVAGSVDLSAVDYESSSDWDLVLSESAPLVESGFGSMELVENQRVKVGKAHSAGGVIGAIYRFTGSEGTEIDLGTVNYETDNRFERASLASDSGLVEVSKGSVVQIASGHTAGGTVGDYYVYTGDSPFEGDLSAVNFNTGIDFIDVASKLLGLEAFGTDEEWVRLEPISASGTQNLDGGHIVQ